MIIFEKTENNVIYYIRDEEGSLIGIKYNNEIYYYIKNLQEDIIGITDNNYNLLCRYEYDSRGRIITIKDNNGNIIEEASHIGIINPYRYRSYYYDKETKLYYLNSRYYNPEWDRFINADGIIEDINNSFSLYVYGNNNPIKTCDFSGKGVSSAFIDIISWGQTIVEKFTGKIAKNKDKKSERKSYYSERKESAFVCEVGYGKGTSVSINGVGISRYTDITHGFRNTDKYSKISGIEYQVGIGIINYSSSYEMESPFPKGFSYYENDSLNAKNMLRSPYVVKSRDLSFLYKNFSVSTNSNDETLFMGLDVDFHLGIGGHVKCGWDSGVSVFNTLFMM